MVNGEAGVSVGGVPATGWHPVALSASIEAGTSAGAVLGGLEIVVWRDTAGAVHVWEDRCPHRGMKLSFGFVRGDHIACLYHGWEYDAGGRCRYIPAHPKLEVPDTIRTVTWSVTEAGGFVFVHWPVGAAPADAPALADGAGLRSLYLDVPSARIHGALGAGFGASAVVQEAHQLIRLSTDLGEIVAGLQEVSANRSALHLAVPAAMPVADRLALLKQAEAFRLSVETGTAATVPGEVAA